MGYRNFSESEYERAKVTLGIEEKHVTKEAEQQVSKTRQALRSVDPSVDTVRRSLMRFDPVGDYWVVTVGVPLPFESECDTTGSMGDNVNITFKVLPQTFSLLKSVLPEGYDLHVSLGIFDDVCDPVIYQRPQFEMTAEKIVSYLRDLSPGRWGGDEPESPHYGLLAAAYLTDAYINRIGLKGYHFCISDATSHEKFKMNEMRRIFGDDVLNKLNENSVRSGRQFTEQTIRSLTIEEVVNDLLRLSHAFFIQVGSTRKTEEFWTMAYSRERVIQIENTYFLPQVEAAIVGLTEGTLTLSVVKDWLQDNGMGSYTASELADQLARIPLGAQEVLRSKLDRPLPKTGDIYRTKADLWPMTEKERLEGINKSEEGVVWL